MDHQTHHDSHHVHAKLPGHHLQVSDGRNLPRNQRRNANRRVPGTELETHIRAKMSRITFILVEPLLLSITFFIFYVFYRLIYIYIHVFIIYHHFSF